MKSAELRPDLKSFFAGKCPKCSGPVNEKKGRRFITFECKDPACGSESYTEDPEARKKRVAEEEFIDAWDLVRAGYIPLHHWAEFKRLPIGRKTWRLLKETVAVRVPGLNSSWGIPVSKLTKREQREVLAFEEAMKRDTDRAMDQLNRMRDKFKGLPSNPKKGSLQ